MTEVENEQKRQMGKGQRRNEWELMKAEIKPTDREKTLWKEVLMEAQENKGKNEKMRKD